MKKMFMAVGLSLIASLASAACFGPFCYDDTGVTIAGLQVSGNGLAIPVVSSITLNALTPYKGQLAYCSTCVSFNGSGKGFLCVSTGTAVGSFVAISSAAAVSVCN